MSLARPPRDNGLGLRFARVVPHCSSRDSHPSRSGRSRPRRQVADAISTSPAHQASWGGRERLQVFPRARFASRHLPEIEVGVPAWTALRAAARSARRQLAWNRFLSWHCGGPTAFGSASANQSRHLDYTASSRIPRNYYSGFFAGTKLPRGNPDWAALMVAHEQTTKERI